MENTSEEFINFTSALSPLGTSDCLNDNMFEIILCYSVMLLCFIVGTPAHLWCLWSYHHFDWKSKQSVIFLLNHTIMELLFCMECALEILYVFCFKNDKLLVAVTFIFGLCWTGRPLIQTCICIEQYLAVLHPVTFLRYKDIKYRIAAVVPAWLAAFGYGLHETMELIFPEPVINVVLFTALAVISFCCVSVLCALKHPGPGDMRMTKQRGRDLGNLQKKNAFNMIASALLIVLLTYLPYLIVSICAAAQIDKKMLYCNILPFLSSFTVYGVMISPVLKMYKDGHLKCFKLRAIKDTS